MSSDLRRNDRGEATLLIPDPTREGQSETRPTEDVQRQSFRADQAEKGTRGMLIFKDLLTETPEDPHYETCLGKSCS